MNRCTWAQKEPNISYHDNEWGMPVHDDRTLFEFLILEGAQAGLSWETILKKRQEYKKVFHNFDVKKVATMTTQDQERLLQNPGIIRNKLKIKNAIQNANAFIKIQQEFGSFDSYLWRFVNGKQIKNNIQSQKDISITTPISDNLSKDLKKRGFNFVGSTIIYAFMQAVGMVDDHENSCCCKK